MGNFSFSGGVEILGFISPTDSLDTYPVIDPLYGIDGFRNVDTLSDLNSIPNPRRRAGMVVGVSGGTTYYKLNPSPWVGNITDWTLFQIDNYVTGYTYQDNTFTIFDSLGNTFNANFNTVTGLTVNGNLTVTGSTSVQDLSATTISATTYYNLPTDVYVTGGTYSNGTTTFTNNTGGTFNVTGYFTGNTMTGQTSVDFGFTGGGESDYAYTVVSNTNISQSSIVMYSVISSDNHQQTEDSLLDGLTFKTSDIVDGVSFTVNCYALNNTWGSYNVFYKIIN